MHIKDLELWTVLQEKHLLKVTSQVNDRVGLEPDTYSFDFIDPLNKLLLGGYPIPGTVVSTENWQMNKTLLVTALIGVYKIARETGFILITTVVKHYRGSEKGPLELNERKTTWAGTVRQDFPKEEMFSLLLKHQQDLDKSKWTRKKGENPEGGRERCSQNWGKKSHCS